MSDDRLTRARDLIFAWREDASVDMSVRSDEVEKLLLFVRQNLKRRIGAGIKFTSFCADCNRRDDDAAIHPVTSVCCADEKSDGKQYLQDLLSFLESAMLVYDALTDVRTVESMKEEVRQLEERVEDLEGEKERLENDLASSELGKEAAEFQLAETAAQLDEMKSERGEEAKERYAKEEEVKLLLSTANTALRFRDAGSLKVFKLKLKEVEKLFYPGYRDGRGD